MRLAIVTPWASPFTYAKPVQHFLNLDIPKWIDDHEWIWSNGWCSARRKEGGIEQAIKWGATHVWLLDADQVVPRDTLHDLVSHVEGGRLPIAAMQPARGWFPGLVERPYQPVCWDLQGKPFTPTKIQQVKYTSLNCIMLSMDTFKAMERPWFTESYNLKTMARLSSLDQKFTARLWNMGQGVWVDPRIRLGHMDATEITWDWQERDWPR